MLQQLYEWGKRRGIVPRPYYADRSFKYIIYIGENGDVQKIDHVKKAIRENVPIRPASNDARFVYANGIVFKKKDFASEQWAKNSIRFLKTVKLDAVNSVIRFIETNRDPAIFSDAEDDDDFLVCVNAADLLFINREDTFAEAWANFVPTADKKSKNRTILGSCCITGKNNVPIVRLHASSPFHGQSKLVFCNSISGFNCHDNNAQGFGAAISTEAFCGYSATLQYLKDNLYYIYYDNNGVPKNLFCKDYFVFWFDSDDADRDMIHQHVKGILSLSHTEEIDRDTKLYVMGLIDQGKTVSIYPMGESILQTLRKNVEQFISDFFVFVDFETYKNFDALWCVLKTESNNKTTAKREFYVRVMKQLKNGNRIHFRDDEVYTVNEKIEACILKGKRVKANYYNVLNYVIHDKGGIMEYYRKAGRAFAAFCKAHDLYHEFHTTKNNISGMVGGIVSGGIYLLGTELYEMWVGVFSQKEKMSKNFRELINNALSDFIRCMGDKPPKALSIYEKASFFLGYDELNREYEVCRAENEKRRKEENENE